MLELGTGTGETARRMLARHAAAVIVGLDASGEILASARASLPADRIEVRIARLEDPLPDGPFDVVVSALTVHHLDGPAKVNLFRRVVNRFTPGGRFVIGDFIALEDRSAPVTALDPDYDTPSTITDQLRWLTEAGLQGEVAWDTTILRF